MGIRGASPAKVAVPVSKRRDGEVWVRSLLPLLVLLALLLPHKIIACFLSRGGCGSHAAPATASATPRGAVACADAGAAPP